MITAEWNNGQWREQPYKGMGAVRESRIDQLIQHDETRACHERMTMILHEQESDRGLRVALFY